MKYEIFNRWTRAVQFAAETLAILDYFERRAADTKERV